jgi:hypothetical protein
MTTVGEVTRINMQPLGRGSSRISPQRGFSTSIILVTVEES